MKKRSRRKSSESDKEETHPLINCNKCVQKFSNKGNLIKHVQSHVQKIFDCQKCNETFNNEDSLRNHEMSHTSVQTFNCDNCDASFSLKKDLMEHTKVQRTGKEFECRQGEKTATEKIVLEEHAESHVKDSDMEEYSCNKCDKTYSDMRKLRRHDWRSHRSIQCVICSEMIESRQEIASHRQDKHQMFRKVICRYFPDCYDDDECLYEHNLREDSCPNGQKCTDQACSFSEQNHKRRSVNLNLCRYQEKCNRIGCIFKHNSTRSTFLGPSQSNKRGK